MADRIDLSALQPDAWIDLCAPGDVTYGQRRRVERAAQRAPEEERIDAFVVARVNALVESWHVADGAGNLLPQPPAVRLEHLDSLRHRIAVRILLAVDAAWRAVTHTDEGDADPNAPPPS